MGGVTQISAVLARSSEGKHIGNQIDPAFVFARADLVKALRRRRFISAKRIHRPDDQRTKHKAKYEQNVSEISDQRRCIVHEHVTGGFRLCGIALTPSSCM
jgi:hypothetical protein